MANRNENENNSYILNFSNADRVQYGDSSYPSTIIPMEDDNGGIGNRRVFMSGDNQLYAMDGNTPRPVIMTYNLPEVAVTSPMESFVNKRIAGERTLSNDNTEVAEIPYSPYQDSLFPKYQALTLPQGVRDNLFTRLLFAVKPEKKPFNRYENSTSRYSLKDDMNDDAPNEWERSSKLGNLGLVKVGENRYKLYDENGNAIKQCAKTRNELEKMLGRPTTNNAWDTFGVYGDSTLFNGYPPKVGPYTWPYYIVQNQIAADRTQRAIENIDLQTGDVVDLYSPFSHYAKRAYTEGTLNRSNSHTGVIFQPYPGIKSKTYIIHNVSGNISVDPINKFLVDGENMFPKWRMTGFHRPGTKEHPYLLNGKPVHK